MAKEKGIRVELQPEMDVDKYLAAQRERQKSQVIPKADPKIMEETRRRLIKKGICPDCGNRKENCACGTFSPTTPTEDPMKILKSRYAKGEITIEQFKEMKKILEE